MDNQAHEPPFNGLYANALFFVTRRSKEANPVDDENTDNRGGER